MRGLKQLVVGVAAIALAACGGGGGEDYPPEVVDQFLASCTAGGTPESVCQCALDEFEAKYSVEEFQEEAQKLAAGDASEEFTQDLFGFSAQCAQEGGE